MKEEIETKPYLGRRILAGIIDYTLIFIFMFTLMHFYGTPNEEGGQSLNGIPALSVILFWGIITIGMEQLFGTTVGNYLNNLKPISINKEEEKISLVQSSKRHLLDIIDISFFGLVGILVIKNTKKHQRLGDLWAKTIVIKSK